MDKAELKERENQIIALIKDFCTQKLNTDCFKMCKDVVKKLSKFEKPPFELGLLNVWAAAVINALGTANGWFLKGGAVHTSVKELNNFFGTNSSTVGNRAKEIREQLDLGGPQHNSIFGALKQMIGGASLIQFDDKFVTIRELPEQLQEIALNARMNGLRIAFTTSSDGENINLHILS